MSDSQLTFPISSVRDEIEKVPFGKQTRRDLYQLDEAITFTNHGSFGAVPRDIFMKRRDLLNEFESCPDKWFRFTSKKLWTSNIDALAEYLKVESNQLVLCFNATEAINSVLKSIEFNGSSDAVLRTQYTYGAIANTIDYTVHYKEGDNGPNVISVPCTFPIGSVDDVLREFETTCELIVNERKLRLHVAVLDHISSATGLLYPVAEICRIIRKWAPNCIIVIDGAHAIGQVDIGLNNLDCDFYVSNLHKWFLCARGCAFMYHRDAHAENLQPSYISWYYKENASVKFFNRATIDMTPLFLIKDCINIYENQFGGLKNITAYNSSLLKRAIAYLKSAWGTESLQVPPELEAPFMKLVHLPPMRKYPFVDATDGIKVTLQMMEDLLFKKNLVAVIQFIQNELYVRISCYVYNEFEDYVTLADAILQLNE